MSKIVNTPYPEDMEVGVEEFSVTYIQNHDTNDNSDHYQRITLSTVVSCATSDTELPYYVNISIPNFDDGTPGHWSLDLTEDITPIVQDFKERLSYCHNQTTKENE